MRASTLGGSRFRFFLMACVTLAASGCGSSGGDPPPIPRIEVSKGSVAFTAPSGGADPAAATIEVVNAGPGTLTGLAYSITYAGSNTGWLTGALSSTTAPATLIAQASTGSLAQGAYDATITLQAANTTANITVHFVVTAAIAPVISLSSTSLTFNWSSGAAPAAQTVNVTNIGVGTLNQLQSAISYTASQATGWLTATLDTQVAPATLSVSVLPGILPNSTYTATVDVSSPVASNSPESVVVSFTVTRGPTIALSSTSLSFSSLGSSGSPPSQTIGVTNSGGGSLAGLATSVSYGAGQLTGWLTAAVSASTAPATITVQVSPGTRPAGSYQATISVSSTSGVNSPQFVSIAWTHTLPAGPTLNTPTVSGTQITLSWTFTWPPTYASSQDRYELEESTVGPSSGFSLIGTFWQSAHVSPFTSPALSRPAAGTYWYRVRAYTYLGFTTYSTVQSTNISAVTATRFQNNSVWSIVSLRIDNVEQFPSAPSGIPTGYYYQRNLTPGFHSYSATSGFWNGGSRFELYTYSGTFNQVAGVIGSVPFSNPTINQLLTRFGSTGVWSGDYWQGLTIHFRTFRFSSNGTFSLYNDGSLYRTGTYQLLNYTAGVVTFRVDYTGGGSFNGTLDEINGYFYMNNGVTGWMTIQYTYQGH